MFPVKYRIHHNSHLLIAESGLALDGAALAYHEEILLALLLQVRQPAGVRVGLKLLSATNDALQPSRFIWRQPTQKQSESGTGPGIANA